ncbi:FG-GAP repeat protein [Novipirellula aureliae]|uniref:FG-GAP repeat protein n=1 Tax=Novipirellula aureliae TaxID=2527966 RepID=A0A5C6DRK1_9BACT|nr:FG-GAP-like repeat-containing protein [Novipirellula aureliae]TWU38834.1 FG-GAP repeat protein [Novipirellula aureliae]
MIPSKQSWIASFAITFSCCLALDAAAQKPVEVTASIQSNDEDTEHGVLKVTLDIKEGWHTNDEADEDSITSTAISLKLPAGATEVGEWERPLGMPSNNSLQTSIFEGQVTFRRKIKINDSALGKDIGVTVRYQACNDSVCNAPQKSDLTVRIPDATTLPKSKVATDPVFDSPVIIMVYDDSRDTNSKLRFPSPAIYDVDGDGQLELVSGSLMGHIGVYENTNTSGKGDPIWGPREPLKNSEGDIIRSPNWCCVGASSQLVDMNGDGRLDILIGSFSGVPRWIERTENGYGESAFVVDKNGDAVVIGDFWNYETEAWDKTNRSGSEGHCSSVAAVDWDDDGDQDLLLGDYLDGKLFLRLNEGSAKETKFAVKNEAVKVGGVPVMFAHGMGAPRVADWNGDGLFDIIIGSIAGEIALLENSGSKGSPRFEKQITLFELLPGKAGSKIAKRVESKDGLPATPGSSFHVDVVDYDGDGDLDLLVGTRCKWLPTPVKEPTKEDEAHLAALSDKIDETYAAYKNARDLANTNGSTRSSTSESSKLFSQYNKLRVERSRLIEGPVETGNFIWLFRRN